jgi:hypothetical protein
VKVLNNLYKINKPGEGPRALASGEIINERSYNCCKAFLNNSVTSSAMGSRS